MQVFHLLVGLGRGRSVGLLGRVAVLAAVWVVALGGAGVASAANNPTGGDPAATTTTVTSSPNPSVFGQSVMLTATVTPVPPATGAPTGTVIFRDDGTQIGTGTLIGAGFTVDATSTLAAGNHTITASYSGDSNFNASTSSPLVQVVNRATTTTSMVSLPNPSLVGQPVTFEVFVSGASEGGGETDGDGDLPGRRHADRDRHAERLRGGVYDLDAGGGQPYDHRELRR